MPVRHKLAPFAGNDGVDHVEQSVDGEEPHEEEVEGHSLGQPVADVQRVPHLLREGHLQQREAPDPDAIDGVGPVDERPAPDHDRQQRKIDPVHPACRE